MTPPPAGLAGMHPAYFALVMATGIVSIASELVGVRAIAVGLFVVNLGFYPLLWILTIARNRATDHVRGKRPIAMGDDLPDLPVPASRASEAAQVLTALRELPEAYQETLILRLVEGMSGPEIAEQTGLSPGSVRVNLHRGMKLLRDKLGIGEEAADDKEVG